MLELRGLYHFLQTRLCADSPIKVPDITELLKAGDFWWKTLARLRLSLQPPLRYQKPTEMDGVTGKSSCLQLVSGNYQTYGAEERNDFDA